MSEKNSLSFASLLDDLLNTPPTRSILRVYLLLFILWNKFYLLNLFFSKDTIDIRIELSKEFVPFYDYLYCITFHQSWLAFSLSFYVAPVILTIIFYHTIPYLYEKGYRRHVTLEGKLIEINSTKTLQELSRTKNEVKIQEGRKTLEKEWNEDLDKLIPKADTLIDKTGKPRNLKLMLTLISNIIYKNRGYFNLNDSELQQVISFCSINKIIQYSGVDQERIEWTDKGLYFASTLNIASDLE